MKIQNFLKEKVLYMDKYPFPSERAREIWNLLYPEEYWKEVYSKYGTPKSKI